MHIDEEKKFDVRTIERSIREGLVTQEEYERYLQELPDVSDKAYMKEEEEEGE
ncbi:MAG: hypothetical protein JRI46_04510 [Deltaproteobacteria bacterium]|nr:hypothetical protein [Deltaproteobacteria bacterium]